MDRETGDLYLTNLSLAAMSQVCEQLGNSLKQPLSASVHRVLSAGSDEAPAPFQGSAVVAPFEVAGDAQGRILLLLPLRAAAAMADSVLGSGEASAADPDVPARVLVEGLQDAFRTVLGDWGYAFQKALARHLSSTLTFRLLGIQPWDPQAGVTPPVGNMTCVEIEFTVGRRPTDVIAIIIGRALADRLVEMLDAQKTPEAVLRESAQITAKLMKNMLPRAVVAEPRPALRRILAQTLKDNGYDVIEAEDGGRAMEAVRRQAPDVVVMNTAMPGLDGFQACGQIRRLPRGDRVAVILCAERALAEDAAAAKQCGADDCVQVQPFQKDAFLPKVAMALAMRKYA